MTLKRADLAPDLQQLWDQVDAYIDEWNDKYDKSAALWGIEEAPMGFEAIALDLFDTYEAGRMYSAEDETVETALMALRVNFEEGIAHE